LNNRGFTLLELLISITMLALITGIMGGALSLAHRSSDKGEKKIHYLERLKASFSLVESQMQSLFPYQYTDDDGQKKFLFSGHKDKLLFSTNYSLWRGSKGNTFVTYDIQNNKNSRLSLKVTEQVIGLENKYETILFDDCEKIGFEYYLKDAFEEGKWVEEWPADNKGMPGKMRIDIACGKNKISLMTIVPAIPTALLTAPVQPVISK
jgi:type II secretion system protein J